jgi:hypothetical protein
LFRAGLLWFDHGMMMERFFPGAYGEAAKSTLNVSLTLTLFPGWDNKDNLLESDLEQGTPGCDRMK